MDIAWPLQDQNLSAERRKAIQELIRGRESANQLRSILGNPLFGTTTDHDGLVLAADDLAMKILGSFRDTIYILNGITTTTDEVSQIPVGSPGRKSEDSDESIKTSALKDRRGCYKRRKTQEIRTRITPTLMDDGWAWRKYGQKEILNAKHPRNYFRCTHKFDQGCQATKHVQKTEDDCPMFRITYHGLHTCKNLLKPPHIIMDSTVSPPGESSFLLSFGSGNPNSSTSHAPFFPSFSSMKQEEYKEEKPILNQNHESPSSSDFLLSGGDMAAFESSGPMTVLSSGSDHGDVISPRVYSCSTASTHSHSLDMDNIIGGVVNFDDDDVLQFEF